MSKDSLIVNPYLENGGGINIIGNHKVPCLTATYHYGYDGYGTRPFIMEIEKKDEMILQLPRGENKGGLHVGKTPTLTRCGWEHNNFLCTRKGDILQNQDKANALCVGGAGSGNNSQVTCVGQVLQLNQSTESGGKQPFQQNRVYGTGGKSPALMRERAGMTINVLEHTDIDNISIRRLTPTECARLQTIPDWYKWKCSETQQYRMLGNGWTVEVIKHILSFMEYGKD